LKNKVQKCAFFEPPKSDHQLTTFTTHSTTTSPRKHHKKTPQISKTPHFHHNLIFFFPNMPTSRETATKKHPFARDWQNLRWTELHHESHLTPP
jgi:hypothetical protein